MPAPAARSGGAGVTRVTSATTSAPHCAAASATTANSAALSPPSTSDGVCGGWRRREARIHRVEDGLRAKDIVRYQRNGPPPAFFAGRRSPARAPMYPRPRRATPRSVLREALCVEPSRFNHVTRAASNATDVPDVATPDHSFDRDFGRHPAGGSVTAEIRRERLGCVVRRSN